MKLRVWMIRHGKTRGNLRGAYIGSTDEPLCPQGAEEIERLKGRGCYSQAEAVYTSPLLRCRQTAALIFPHQQAQIVESLRECSFGEFEGKNYQDLNGDSRYQAWIDSGGTIPFPGGEDPMEFRRRCARGFLRLCREQKEKERIAVICHGGTIMAVLEAFGQPAGDFYRWQVKNGEGYSFLFDTAAEKAEQIEKIAGES